MSHLAYPTSATYPQGSQWSRVLKSFVLHTQCPCSSQQYTTALASFPIALLANVIWHATTSTNLYNALWRPFCHTRFEYGFGPKTLFCWSWCSPQVYQFWFASDKFDYFGSNRDLTFDGHFATPVDGSKTFLCKDVQAYALYQPTKFQPARLSHLRVYRLVLYSLWRPFCHARFEYGFGPKILFCWSWCSPQIYRFSFAYDKFDYFGGNRDLMFGGHFAHPLTDLKNSFVRTFRHMPSTNPPSFSPLGLAISESIG